MPMPASMTAAEVLRARSVFERDQARASRHQRTEDSAVVAARVIVCSYAGLGAYAIAAVFGLLPAMPWSALG